MGLFTAHLPANNWCIRFAYFGSDYIPPRTNLCKLFWRCVFRTAVFAVLLALLGHALVWIYVWTNEFLGGLIIIVCLLLLATILYCSSIGIHRAWRYLRDDLIDDRPAFNPVKEYARAVKSKVCPMIVIERDE